MCYDGDNKNGGANDMTSSMEDSIINETATKFAYEHSWIALTDEIVNEKIQEAENDFASGDTFSWEEVKRRVRMKPATDW